MNKIAALLLALTAAFSFSQESHPVPAEKPIVCDTEPRVNSDSVTLKALKDVETFYSNSFKDIQSSFHIFLAIVGIIVTIVCAALAFFGTFNWSENRTYKKNLDKIRKELEEEKELLEKNCKDLYGEIEYTYFSLAIANYEMKDYKEHFENLAEHFATFRKRNIKPEDIDFKRLKRLDEWIKEYNDDDFEIAKIFLCELKRFIDTSPKYSKDINSAALAYLEKSNEIWQKLCDKFGGQDKITEAIKNFKSHL